MKTTLTAIALAAGLAQPASAITFPSLTTIYVGSGVTDNGSNTNLGIATAFHCTNVSGASASVRVLVLNLNGTVAANITQTLAHGATRTWSTHAESPHREDFLLSTGEVEQGAVNIESSQSAVFCNAVVLDAADFASGYVLPLVRVNPHPGTVE